MMNNITYANDSVFTEDKLQKALDLIGMPVDTFDDEFKALERFVASYYEHTGIFPSNELMLRALNILIKCNDILSAPKVEIKPEKTTRKAFNFIPFYDSPVVRSPYYGIDKYIS